MKKTLFAALILAAGLLALGLCLRSGLKSFTDSQRVVTVRGLAEREVKANKVTWPISFTLVGNDLPSLYLQMEKSNAVVTNYLTSNGLSAQEFTIGAPRVTDLQADRYSSGNVPFRYNLTSTIAVVSSQVDLVRELINRQGEIIKQGIAIAPSSWNNEIIYEYTDLNDIKPDMIAEATANARAAADKFAQDSQSKIGKIRTAQQGQFSIDDRDPYSPFIKNVRVVSTLTFMLED